MMNSVVVTPKIGNPFKGTISPHAESVQKTTIDWAVNLEILQMDTVDKYEKEKLGYLASRIQPDDEFEDIVITSDYLLLFCILDDYSDKVESQNEFREYLDFILSIFENENNFPKDDLYLHGWYDWWNRVKQLTDIEWRSNFILNVIRFFESLHWEISYRLNKQIPDLKEYMVERQYTGSGFPVFNLIEKSKGNYIPKEIKNDIYWKLVDSTNNIVNWTNDLVSLKRELAIGDVHNLVICLQNQNKITIQEAVNKVEKMHNDEIIKFLELEKEFLEHNINFRLEADKCITGMRYCISGYYDWSKSTDRY